MELRAYVKILLGSLWIIVPMTMLALTVTLLYSYTQQPIYEATSSYIIAFSGGGQEIDQADRYYILEALVGRQQIGVNFCSAITAGDNVNLALKAIGITDAMIEEEIVDIGKYTWACNVLPESSVLLLIVTGPSQEVVLRLNETLGQFGSERALSLYNNMLALEILDSPYLEEEPISPNHIQNAVLGVALGIGVSLTIALLMDYFKSPLEKMEAASIREPLTNAYNTRYFIKRMQEEVERSKQRNRPIAVALLELQPNEDYGLLPQLVQDEFLHQASLYIQDKVHQGDIVAYRGDLVFEILLPETPGYEARSRLMVVHSALRSHLFRTEQHTTSFTCQVGIVESGGEALNKVDLLAQARESLKLASEERSRHVHLLSTQSRAFVSGDDTFSLDSVLDDEDMIQRIAPDDKAKRDGAFGFFPALGRRKNDSNTTPYAQETLETAAVGSRSGRRVPTEREHTVTSLFGTTDIGPLDTGEFDLEQQLGDTGFDDTVGSDTDDLSAPDPPPQEDFSGLFEGAAFASPEELFSVSGDLDIQQTLAPDDYFFSEGSDDLDAVASSSGTFNRVGLFDDTLPQAGLPEGLVANGNGNVNGHHEQDVLAPDSNPNFGDFVDLEALLSDEDTSEIEALYYDPTTDVFTPLSQIDDMLSSSQDEDTSSDN